ncbi:unnamed protein product [Plasmodium vivax]|uniref:ATP-dependent RNA helicase n=4 Tax=Plasmodium vivax TaxID=5855 RepID=A5K9E1_PLAVS|nr:DEAD-box subfamily ATP-dependant helicase [Plasmodium vivax]KMZ80155.1 DEAD-box subfamily ATP-dependent helicase [Plasmodium vivax India VII]KMZ86241.1 DEAD-box subfamily ATP-dependent helicase [Plasmodium vivax Brazil I]EDL44013.1 DEAD-box subfamily ATP-dependent helicase, putative [Plasmodium vivax]CAG9474855.1 unnamed protein product [Plasmodium vivax]CAI7720918.1 ATP-dependent RNA helicase DDX1, putative [Plasmodium vivax]|eukprot:XP_001613740.1 DEAD-box subfamily ATP-dependant helicase [Plasmodium vivax Sal-1]
MSAFEELGLHSNLCELLEKNGIDLPTAIQQESIPLILGGGDVCASAETGTGKTLSFIVSSLQIVHELFRNIGTYESSGSSVAQCGSSKRDIDNGEITSEVKKGGLLLKVVSGNNSRVILNNALGECTCSGEYSSSFEEVKVGCEIRSGMYAYEIEVLGRCFLNVGFCPSVKETLKYNYTYCSNGNKYTNGREENYADSFATRDIITCLINKNTNVIAFKKNGKFLGNAFKIFYKYNDLPFFPYICGKFFHVKFHFANLKYADASYAELNEVMGSGQEDSSFTRKVYYGGDPGGDSTTAKFETKQMQSGGPPTAKGVLPNGKVDAANRTKLYCIVLCPTRDLAMQTYNNYLIYAESFSSSSINIGLLVGGEQPNRDKRNQQQYSNILVCTCFKLMECIKKNTINLNDVRLLILDEADELINNDEKSVLQIKEISTKHSQHVQTCFYSATLQDQNVKDCINKITNKPIFVDLKYGKNSIPTHIYVCVYYVNNKNANLCYAEQNKKEKMYDDIIYNEKLHAMSYEMVYEYTDKVHLLNCAKNEKEKISLNVKINKLKKLIHIINIFNMQNGIIFCRTNLDCDNVYNFLNHLGDGKAYKGTVETMKENKYSCVILKGKMSNTERKNNLDAFKKGEVRFLICTDVAARGIDIQNLRYLIIMTLSDNINSFFHKIGRVGRDGKNSLCIVLSAECEEEKVWFHTCPSRGVNCYNRNLKDNKGCTVYIKEADYIQAINNMLETPMHVLDSKYYYAENVVDPLNYLKNNPVSNKSRRNKSQSGNTIFAEPLHTDVIGCFGSSIENIKKLQSDICCRYYESAKFAL